jgi:hypothetical protein
MRVSLGRDLWIRCAFENEPLPPLVVMSDCRYRDEAYAIEERGGFLIRLEGDPAGVRRENRSNRDLNHPSETDLDHWPFVHVIQNNSTVAVLRTQLTGIIAKELTLMSLCK